MSFLRSRFFLVVSLAVWLLPVAPLQARNTDFNAAKKSTQKLLKPGKFQEIEALGAKYRAESYTIIDRWPAIYGFHEGISITGVEDDHQWQQRRQFLEGWVEAFPQSCTAKTALAEWWVGYAWKARGIGRAPTVTDTGWKLMYERLNKAVKILETVEPEAVDDPEYYRVFLTALRGKGSGYAEKAQACFEQGAAAFKEYYPLHRSHVYFLLPRWYGEEGDHERAAAELANRFPPEKGDILYAYLIYSRANFDKDTEFKTWAVDYERVKRGYLHLIEDHPSRYHAQAQSELCFIASLKEDYTTAKKLFLESDHLRTSTFGDWEALVEMRKACGAQAAIDEALLAEKEGRLDDAEALYRSFTPDPATNHWLASFYLCHGMKEKLHATQAGPRFDIDVAKANANTWYSLALRGPLVQEWEITKDAAQRFDAVRPFNLAGRAALLLCAARDGNREQAEALRKAIVEYKSNRPAYKAVQTVLSGEKTWEEAAPALMKSDGLSQHAGLTLAAYYLTQENHAQARTIIEAMLSASGNNRSFATVFSSFLHGSLAPMLKDDGKKEPPKADTGTAADTADL